MSSGAPAPLAPRIAAGLLDASVLVILSGALALVPLTFGAVVLPMLGAFAAILVWDVAPLVTFRATPGMALFGLELRGTDGRPAEPHEVFFRELLGRGMIGFAYLATAGLGLVGIVTGSLSLFAPVGLGLVLLLVAGSVVALALAGLLVALGRPDRRGLPDLMAGTLVQKRAPLVDVLAELGPLDDDDRARASATHRRGLRRFVVFEVLALASAAALPWALSAPSRGAEDFAARAKTAAAEQRFAQAPADPERAADLIDHLMAAGQPERAAAVRTRHADAVAEQGRTKEAALRASLARDPTDWDTFTRLLELLEEGGRTTEGRAAFEHYLAAEGSADTRASFGLWLYDHDQPAEAARELEKAIAAGADGPSAWAYLGWSLLELGRKAEARTALAKALSQDPDLEQVRADLAAIESELKASGPTP